MLELFARVRARSIRGTSSDGLTWIIDANAPHANEIQVDKVLFATERCVGKVFDVQRSGDELKVILGPAQITDVLSKATSFTTSRSTSTQFRCRLGAGLSGRT